ncbi:hypothetical protein TNCV_3425541 [Trichonephila clavipes]|nr:hypothetical protein TNCV_3425541 [Trichonephila clavipes]
MSNEHRTDGDKTHLVGENRENSSDREDDEPDKGEWPNQWGGRGIWSTLVGLKKPTHLLCLDNEHILGGDQGYTPEIMDEILTTARDLELEVNEDDIMGHED